MKSCPAVILVLFALVASPVTAQDASTFYGMAPALSPAIQPTLPRAPDQILRSAFDRLAGFLIGSGNPTPRSLRVFLDHEIARHFDFASMAKWAAGPLYRRLDSDQRVRFAVVLKNTFLTALAKNLGSFSRPLPQVEVSAVRPGANPREARVHARVLLDSGLPARLEFRFYWNAEGWKIFDVTANGASAVAFYRRYYGNLFRRYGPVAVLGR